MPADVPAARLRRIARIVAALRTLSPQPPARAAEFLRCYFRGVGEEDLAERTPAYLAGAALAHLRLGSTRPGGRPRVAVFDPPGDGSGSRRMLVAVVARDMPFLVDSMGMVFSRAGIGVHLIIHPVLDVTRGAGGRLRDVRLGGRAHLGGSAHPGAGVQESWQLFEIDRLSGAQRIAALTHALLATLADVRLAAEDGPEMLEQAGALAGAAGDARAATSGDSEDLTEARALLSWMTQGNFIFLGYRHYGLRRGRAHDLLMPTPDSGRGILRAPRPGVPAPGPTRLAGPAQRYARGPAPVLVTKANTVATIHRAAYLDYVGLKTFDARGRVTGEHRFLGLWTAAAWQRSPWEVPVLRRKVAQVAAQFGALPGHDAKALAHALAVHPRDELFQAGVSELVPAIRGIVNLYERRHVRLFLRRDPFGRFWSALVYVPRDRYNSAVRARIEAVLRAGLDGREVESQVQISESALARLHIVVRTDAGSARANTARMERAIAAATVTWEDGLREALAGPLGESAAIEAAARFTRMLPAAYTEDVSPRAALPDLQELEALQADPGALRLRLAAGPGGTGRVHLRIIHRREPLPISDVLPMMENFGLRVIAERPYELAWPEGGPAWIQDFELEFRDAPGHADAHGAGRRAARTAAALAPLLTRGIEAVWRGEVDNDGFNRLLPAALLTVREISVLRACCRYLLQAGMPFSQAYMERALLAHPQVARSLFGLFALQADPALPARARARTQVILQGMERALQSASLDEDRILRALLHVVRATLRTNFYQRSAEGRPRPALALKLDPHAIPELPAPRPKFEVFVHSPQVEAVHLRMSSVARGGIRWSDRPEDFRTEVLGLMKAQNVKNTVIVPMGAKGGFVVRRPAAAGPERQRQGIACYQVFMRSLLDVTDNIAGGSVVPPPAVVRRDGDDPYLVVAADKGTASFSDIANGIAAEYGFWLGDAFASGGSAGYDHKQMAITARGAWECVKRHFRELGKDIQQQPFTVVGIGDMSGDVFGNGMLLSRQIRLIAAFDHRHIFLDPDPDPAAGFAERSRLAALPASSWDDYDRRKISRGGGVFPRSAKSIALSREARTALGVQSEALTAPDLIRAILAAPVELLWNGGIGTYVKAASESNADIGDRANDAVRINGAQLRAKVAGEGGNLGFSQRGRIEYALGGGRLNTDFIDNSAGVNTSDVEVNIKILLNPLERSGRLTRARRNRLLAGMTSEVAQLVLRNNYLQGQALSILEQHAAQRLPEHGHFIAALERGSDLDRALEFLPDEEALAARRKQGLGLTRPELAVLLAYGKIWLSHLLAASDIPADPYLSGELDRYFPEELRRRFGADIAHHRLRREIIATAITNSLVNRMGPTFVMRAQEDTGAEPARIARAYTAAREITGMRVLWSGIEALDNRVPCAVQYDMMFETGRLLRHMTYWLLSHRPRLSIEAAVAELRAGVQELDRHVHGCLTGSWRTHLDAVVQRHLAAGVPAALAQRIGALDAHNCALDIVDLAAARRVPVTDAARLYFGLGAELGMDWLHEQIEKLAIDGNWQAVARTGLRDNLYRTHRRIAELALAAGRGPPAARVQAFLRGARELPHWTSMLESMEKSGAADFATLSVGVETLRRLAG